MRLREHPRVCWLVEHMVLLYIALVVTAILPLLVLEMSR